jgi:hypothetical protein
VAECGFRHRAGLVDHDERIGTPVLRVPGGEDVIDMMTAQNGESLREVRREQAGVRSRSTAGVA